jgi:hypothetical protein
MRHRPNSLVPEHPGSVLGTAGLRGLDWARSPAVTLRLIRPPGRELNGSHSARLVLTRGGRPQGPITNQRKRIKKQFGDSAPTARPQKTGAPLGSRLHLEWLAAGFTAQSFWTAAWRWITRLESQLRSGLTTRLRLTRLSPYRCLAGRPMVRAVKRN